MNYISILEDEIIFNPLNEKFLCLKGGLEILLKDLQK